MIFKSKPDIAEFLGWHIGDGCISISNKHYEYTLAGDLSEEYSFYKEVVIPSFNAFFYKHLGKKIILRKYPSVGVCGVYIFNKKFVMMLQKNFNLIHGKKTNVTIPTLIKTHDQKRNFLRGLFDTDGSIYFCKSYVQRRNKSLCNELHYIPKIKIATISKVLIRQIYLLLWDLGFHPRIQKPIRQRKNELFMHSIVMDTKKDIIKWIKEIGFRSIKHRSKVLIWEKFGFCPPKTTLYERLKMLNGSIDPLKYYSNINNLSFDLFKEIRLSNSNF